MDAQGPIRLAFATFARIQGICLPLVRIVEEGFGRGISGPAGETHAADSIMLAQVAMRRNELREVFAAGTPGKCGSHSARPPLGVDCLPRGAPSPPASLPSRFQHGLSCRTGATTSRRGSGPAWHTAAAAETTSRASYRRRAKIPQRR